MQSAQEGRSRGREKKDRKGKQGHTVGTSGLPMADESIADRHRAPGREEEGRTRKKGGCSPTSQKKKAAKKREEAGLRRFGHGTPGLRSMSSLREGEKTKRRFRGTKEGPTEVGERWLSGKGRQR